MATRSIPSGRPRNSSDSVLSCFPPPPPSPRVITYPSPSFTFSFSPTDMQTDNSCMSLDSSYLARRANTSYNIQSHTSPRDAGWGSEIDEIIVLSSKVRKSPEVVDSASTSLSRETVEWPPLDEAHRHPACCRHSGAAENLFSVKTLIVEKTPNRNKTNSRSQRQLDVFSRIKSLLSHSPFLPHVYRLFHEEVNCHIQWKLIMDYVPSSQSLLTRLLGGPLDSQLAHFWFCELYHAVSQLHAVGIVHRSLHPVTVLIDPTNHILLTGFDQARVCEQNLNRLEKHRSLGHIQSRHLSQSRKSVASVHSFQGVENACIAPEISVGWTHDYLVDVWGLGVLLWCMNIGLAPFYVTGPNGQLEPGPPPNVSGLELDRVKNPAITDLLERCLERNPALRISMSEAKDHAYLALTDWSQVASKTVLAHGTSPLDTPIPTSHPIMRPSSISSPTLPIQNKGTNAEISGSLFMDPVPNTPKPSKCSNSSSASLSPIHENANIKPSPAVKSTVAMPHTESDEVSRSKRMALFWDDIDAEVTAASTSHSFLPAFDFHDIAFPNHSNKLRKIKSRSCFSKPHSLLPWNQQSSNSSTPQTAPEKRLGRSKSVPVLLRAHDSEHIIPTPSTEAAAASRDPVNHVELPQDIEQIGEGIGFTYQYPAAVHSKASIYTSESPQHLKQLSRMLAKVMKKVGGRVKTADHSPSLRSHITRPIWRNWRKGESRGSSQPHSEQNRSQLNLSPLFASFDEPKTPDDDDAATPRWAPTMGQPTLRLVGSPILPKRVGE